MPNGNPSTAHVGKRTRQRKTFSAFNKDGNGKDIGLSGNVPRRQENWYGMEKEGEFTGTATCIKMSCSSSTHSSVAARIYVQILLCKKMEQDLIRMEYYIRTIQP